MSPSTFLVALLIASATSGATPSTTQGPPPTPPRQADPWEPPRTALPRFFLSATADLFSQGLADPRGCEYRRIVLKVGQVWGGGAEEVEVAGWVLPPAEGAEGPRFAVAWNGLVYPVTRLGAPADFEADARSIVAHSPGLGRSLLGFYGATSEAEAVGLATPMPVRICLLLRLGRADLAETVWERCTGRPPVRAGREDGSGLDLNSHGLSYLSLARDLAWYHFDRAICAHMRGDDPTALADARFLDGFAKAVDARAEAMGFDPPSRPGGGSAYIDFLGQLPELLADQERRAREPARPLLELPEPTRESRIAALIRDLDQVAARQSGQPGGVSLRSSPIVEALIGEGEAAIEPLMRASREDNRLTRSVGFGRDFLRGRTVLRASQAAHAALSGIRNASDFKAARPDGLPPDR